MGGLGTYIGGYVAGFFGLDGVSYFGGGARVAAICVYALSTSFIISEGCVYTLFNGSV